MKTMFLGLAVLLACTASVTPPGPAPISTQGQPLRAMGTNGAGLFETLGGTDSASYQEGTNALGALGPITLRLPGGAISRFHDPARVRRGWGLDEAVINAHFDAHPPDPDEVENDSRKKWLDDAAVQPGDSYVDRLVALAKDHDVRVIWVLNILTASVTANLTVLHELIDRGIRVIGVEGGNELYSKYPTFDLYAAAVQPLFDRIHAELPAIPRSLDGAPMKGRKEHIAWNDGASKYLADHPSAAEAVSLHPYLASSDMPDCYQLYASYADAKPKTALAFDTADSRVAPAFGCARDRFTAWATADWNAMFTSTAQLFPHHAIWITEWNIKPSSTFGNTLLQGMLHLRLWLRGLREPQIAVFTVHNGIAPDVFGLLSRTRTLDAQATSLTSRVARFSYELAVPANDGAAKPLTLTSPPSAIVGAVSHHGHAFVYFVNDGTNAVSFDADVIGVPLRMRRVGGRQLYSSAGQTDVLADDSAYDSAPPGVEIAGITDTPYTATIPPMSFGYVEIEQKP
ncbi:hypothetical protein BH09MYX1_BH09MYX1_47610 [soil metagenome]